MEYHHWKFLRVDGAAVSDGFALNTVFLVGEELAEKSRLGEECCQGSGGVVCLVPNGELDVLQGDVVGLGVPPNIF